MDLPHGHAATSLDNSALQSAYAKAAVDYIKQHPDKDTENLLKVLKKQAVKTLTKVGVHPPQFTDDDQLASIASFQPGRWWIVTNNGELPQGDLSEISPQELKDMTTTFYHEAVHCEQAFRVMQSLAEQGKPRAEIAGQVHLRRGVRAADDALTAAMAAPGRAAVPADVLSHTRRLEPMMFGGLSAYAQWVSGQLLPNADELRVCREKADEAGAPERFVELLHAVRTQHLGTAERNIAALAKSEAANGDDAMLRGRISRAIKNMMAVSETINELGSAWDRLAVKDAAAISGLQDPVQALYEAADLAYKTLPHEAQAFTAEETVGAAFDALLAVPPAPAGSRRASDAPPPPPPPPPPPED